MPSDDNHFEDMVVFNFGLFCKVTAEAKSGYALIDTGATNSGITEVLAQNLKPVRQSATGGAHGQSPTNIYELPSLEFAGQSFHNVRVSQAQAYEEFPSQVFMRLGTPQLLSKPLILDFKQLKIGFTPDLAKLEWRYPSSYFVHGLPFMELSHHDKPVQALFDSGAGFSVLNSARLEELGITFSKINTYTLPVTDVNGQTFEQTIVVVQNLECAGHMLPATEFILMDFSGVEKTLNQRLDLVLGANTMLRAGWIWLIDRPQNSIGFSTEGFLNYP